MKYYVMNYGYYGSYVEKVNGKPCKFCSTAFTYKNKNGLYYVIDSASGLSITSSWKFKDLEEKFNKVKETYERVKNTQTYDHRVEEFERNKMIYERKKSLSTSKSNN